MCHLIVIVNIVVHDWSIGCFVQYHSHVTVEMITGESPPHWGLL